MQDVRFALRQLRRAPAFAVVAIATLALAIGVSTAVFSVLEATVIRPLPYHDASRIVGLVTYSPEGYTQPASWGQYKDWRSNNHTLSALAGYEPGSANLESANGAAPIRAVYTTDNFFDVFEVKPILGRTFRVDEGEAGHNDVVILSYELWRQTLGGRKDVVGSMVRVDGVPNEVIGVMPAGFRFPLSVNNALYRPMHLTKSRLENRGAHFLPTIGRLKPGVTMQQAQVDLQHVFDEIGRQYPDEAGRKLKLKTIAELSLGNTSGPLRVLTLAVFGVLIIGCVNIAGLLLARGIKRQRELGLRSAIGAGRGRLAQQLLTESAILSLTGAAAGVVLAAGLLQVMRQLLIHSLARGADVELNLPVLGATAAVALLTGLAAGAFPAVQSARTAPALVLRSGGSAGTSRGQNRLRSGLILIQVALALGLLICSGLLLRQLHGLRSTELGFSPDHLLTEELEVTAANYEGRSLLTSYYEPLLKRVQAIPGVTSVGVINLLPVQDWGSNSDVHIAGKPPAPPHQEELAETRMMSPGTAETIGAHLVRGRGLSPAMDRADVGLHAVVNEAFVRKFFGSGEDPVGRQIEWGGTKVDIVGVVSDLRQDLAQPPLAEMDLAAAQIPAAYSNDELTHLTLVIRTAGDPKTVAADLREAMRQVDARVPFRVPLTMEQVIAETLTFERLESWLFGIFAGLALTLSLVGIYGMVQHEVELRTRDIGIRMALGATRGTVVAQIVRQVALLMMTGVAMGWVLTLAMQKSLSAVVVLHAAKDGLLLAGLSLLLAVIGVTASLVPAGRAAAIDPMQALRTE